MGLKESLLQTTLQNPVLTPSPDLLPPFGIYNVKFLQKGEYKKRQKESL